MQNFNIHHTYISKHHLMWFRDGGEVSLQTILTKTIHSYLHNRDINNQIISVKF
jgi:hypothetical protein